MHSSLEWWLPSNAHSNLHGNDEEIGVAGDEAPDNHFPKRKLLGLSGDQVRLRRNIKNTIAMV